MKGKSSAWMKKKIKRTRGLYEQNSLWARGYFVSTVGIDEFVIRRYVKHQNHHNEVDQPSLFQFLTRRPPAGVKPANTKPPALRPVVVYFIEKY